MLLFVQQALLCKLQSRGGSTDGVQGVHTPPPPSDIQHPLRKLWYCIRRLQLSLNGPIRNAIKSDVKLDLTDLNFVCCKKRYVTSLKKTVENVIITTSCTDHVSG